MKSGPKHIQSSLLAMSFALLLAIGCSSNNPVAPGNNNQNNQTNKSVTTTAKDGVEVFNNISSFKEIDELLQGPDGIVDLEVPDFQNPSAAANFAQSMTKKSLALLQKRPGLMDRIQSSAADSVIWDVTVRDDKAGVTYRSSLIYDPETGRGCLFLVGKEYRETHPLEYDSTKAVVDLNFTIFNESDDVLISIENLKRFKPDRLIREEFGSFIPDPFPAGSEPTGGILTNQITYDSASFISSTDARLEYHEGSGGGYSKVSKFSDGSEHSESATFNEDGTGSFEETRRDGTHIQGTFDSPENDGQGSFTKEVTFPAGHDPASVSESGNFTINPSDSTLSGTFQREVVSKDGDVKREQVTVDQTVVGDVKSTTLNIEKNDGSGGFINIVETPDVDQVTGEWTNADETFGKFTAESYPDGSAHLEFKLYESEVAFENGQEPVVSGVFDFYPDGSGKGTVIENGITYDVIIHPDGSVTVTKRE